MSNIEEEIEALVVWGCSRDDAEKAIQSQRIAIGEIIGNLFGGENPYEGLSAVGIEEMFILTARENPQKGVERIIGTPCVADRYHSDPAAFYDRVAKILRRKSTAMPLAESIPKWLLILIAAWTMGDRLSPPRCLWTDSAIRYLSNIDLSDEAIRQHVHRARLYRPKAPCYGVEEAQHGLFRWIPRTRGTVTKKK